MPNHIMRRTFNVNFIQVDAGYYDKDIRELFIPLLKTLTEMQRRLNRRFLLFLAAPPGAGKTTFSLFLAHLSDITDGITKIQPLGIDGFHFHAEYIKNNTINVNGVNLPMAGFKGCPETYDLGKLKDKLQLMQKCNVKWPMYDRRLHDVVEESIEVDAEIVLIEGNWLLLDEPGWKELKGYCDYSIFLHANEEMLEGRLIRRKIQGGLNPREAREFYDRSDRLNVRRTLCNRLESDLELRLLENGAFVKAKY